MNEFRKLLKSKNNINRDNETSSINTTIGHTSNRYNELSGKEKAKVLKLLKEKQKINDEKIDNEASRKRLSQELYETLDINNKPIKKISVDVNPSVSQDFFDDPIAKYAIQDKKDLNKFNNRLPDNFFDDNLEYDKSKAGTEGYKQKRENDDFENFMNEIKVIADAENMEQTEEDNLNNELEDEAIQLAYLTRAAYLRYKSDLVEGDTDHNIQSMVNEAKTLIKNSLLNSNLMELPSFNLKDKDVVVTSIEKENDDDEEQYDIYNEIDWMSRSI